MSITKPFGKRFAAVTALGFLISSSLFSCGKRNYAGTYSGYEQPLNPTNGSSQLALGTQQNTISIQVRQTGQNITALYTANGLTGYLVATTRTVDRWDDAQLTLNTADNTAGVISTPGYAPSTPAWGSTCPAGIYTGTIIAANNGVQLSGELTLRSGASPSDYYGLCSGRKFVANRMSTATP